MNFDEIAKFIFLKMIFFYSEYFNKLCWTKNIKLNLKKLVKNKLQICESF